jgi:hypothetical protein
MVNQIPAAIARPFSQRIFFTHATSGLLIYSAMARGARFQLANAAYVQFAILLPLPSSQAGSLRHD